MENRIIRMTQDLLDRGCELGGNYEYVSKCFRKNLKIMAENTNPKKKEKNLSDEWENGACTRLQIIDDKPDASMDLIIETPASGGICVDLTPPSKIKCGPQGLLIHSTGAAQSSAQSNVNTFNEVKTDKEGNLVVGDNGLAKGTHAFVAPNDIVQCLPWNFMSHHCAGFFNYTHIGLDLVEPDTNEQNKEQFVLDTYETMVELAAYLCGQYKLDPMGFMEYKIPGKKKTLKVPVILSHKEAHALGGASNHGDPDKMWNSIKIGGVALTMDKFRADVNNRKGKANFYYVTDKWDKHISMGKKLPDKMVYTKGETVGDRITRAKYPYELGKINLEECAVTIPMIRDDDRWFPKTYPLHKPGYRVAYNDRTAAIKAAQIATEAARAAGDIDKNYNIYDHMGEILFSGAYKYKTGPAGPSTSSAPVSFGINASVLEK